MKNRKMTTATARLGVSIILLMILAVSTASGQYEISWYTVDGGGGTSSGGPYTLTGTIGQLDAGWSIGGNYELLGGFWPGEAIIIIKFQDLAELADRWPDSDLTSDPVQDDFVDFDELIRLANYWLDCCPCYWTLS